MIQNQGLKYGQNIYPFTKHLWTAQIDIVIYIIFFLPHLPTLGPHSASKQVSIIL